MAQETKSLAVKVVPENVSAKTAPRKEKQNLQYKRDKNREMVRGIFRYHEVPGGEMGFAFREFKGDPIENYLMVDGEMYTIPLGVAKHLNINCWYPQYEYLPGDRIGESGIQGLSANVRGFAGHVQRVTKKTHRCAFNSLEFLDIEDLPQPASAVVSVETVFM